MVWLLIKGDSDIPSVSLVLFSVCPPGTVIVGVEDVGSFKDEPSCPMVILTVRVISIKHPVNNVQII